MGVPIETGTVSGSSLFEDEVGYRVRREAYALPEASFTPDEMAVLALAARAWQSAALAGAASRALLKLQASGAQIDDVAVAGLEPRVEASEPAFLPLVRAVRDRRVVRFDYRTRGDGEPQRREVEPWGVVSWHGRWYLVGHDRGRDATRVFRLGRVVGDVTARGKAGAVTVPEGVDLRAEVASRAAARSGGGRAVVRLRSGHGGWLRRQAEPAPGRAEVGKDEDGWDVLALPYSDLEMLADDVAGLGPDAVALEPAELRAAVVRRLRAALAVAAGGRQDGGRAGTEAQQA
ncbi:helix-turn-helix transcriptional regulator [Motilibacter deserti]|nr:WYL domain-containing protein [Motilibacter deserti]